MKNQLTLLIGVVLLVVLLAYMFLFQVRYDEVAVVTTFGSAQAPQDYDAERGEWAEPGSVIDHAGLNFRLPPPIQTVHRYPRQQQVLDMRLSEQLTADNFSVTVQAYLIWQIVDPYTFFQNAERMDYAAGQLRSAGEAAVGARISDYRFDELVNTDAEQLRLDEFEEAVKEDVRERLEGGTDYGVEIKHVGVHRLKLPEATTEQVFERMRVTRERLADQARSEGEAQANRIRSQAETARSNILAFTERRAQEIRDLGREEAARYYRVFQEDEEFAMFLTNLEALREIVGHNATVVLDADNLGLLRWLREDPELTPAPVEDDAVDGADASSDGSGQGDY